MLEPLRGDFKSGQSSISLFYREMLLVPFEVRIVVLGKRLDALEGRLLVMYITDRYAYETLLQQVNFTTSLQSLHIGGLKFNCK